VYKSTHESGTQKVNHHPFPFFLEILRSQSNMSSYAEVAAANVNGIDSDSTPISSRKDSGQDQPKDLQRKGFDLVGKAIEHYPKDKPYCTSIPEAPVTFERKPYVHRDSHPLLDPGTARATIAPTNENPNGTTDGNWARENQHQTVCNPRQLILQKERPELRIFSYIGNTTARRLLG
jgi:hypothetical protein